MTKGTVKWFNVRKGYGFIIPESGGKDIFVHITKVQEMGLPKLSEGAKIYYEPYDDRGRIAAGNLRLL
ncbi:cold-shock protein [bacterium]|nr:cold-shock protein [bacterium]MBR1399495.1 cold-shock protein [Alphaproteobacteria bacterium]